MEYTNDIVLNVKYANSLGAVRLKKERFIKKLIRTVKENKFITTILLTMTAMILINIMLVNMFMNLLVTL